MRLKSVGLLWASCGTWYETRPVSCQMAVHSRHVARRWKRLCQLNPFTRYNRLSNRLHNRFDNRLYRVNKHPTSCQTGCQTGLTTVLNEQPLFVQPVVKPGLRTVLNEQLFVQPVVKPRCTSSLTTGCIHDTAGCQSGYGFDNRFDNRLYRVNGALWSRVRETTKLPRILDRSQVSSQGRTSSDRYCGAVPRLLSNIKVHSLNWILLNTGSQWSCFRRDGVGYASGQKSSSSVLHMLQTVECRLWAAGKQTVTIIQTWHYQHQHIQYVIVNISWFRHQRTIIVERTSTPIGCDSAWAQTSLRNPGVNSVRLKIIERNIRRF